MKNKAGFLITVIAVAFLLSSCTSTPDIHVSIESVSIEKEPTPDSLVIESEYLSITTPYTLESLLVPVVQMNDFMMSLDYFDQFLEYNDYIFPDYLFRIIGMETTDYSVGEGTVLYSKEENGSYPFRFEKALLSRDESGNSWWQFSIEFNGYELFLEVLSNEYNIPQKIRSIDKVNGLGFEILNYYLGLYMFVFIPLIVYLLKIASNIARRTANFHNVTYALVVFTIVGFVAFFPVLGLEYGNIPIPLHLLFCLPVARWGIPKEPMDPFERLESKRMKGGQ